MLCFRVLRAAVYIARKSGYIFHVFGRARIKVRQLHFISIQSFPRYCFCAAQVVPECVSIQELCPVRQSCRLCVIIARSSKCKMCLVFRAESAEALNMWHQRVPRMKILWCNYHMEVYYEKNICNSHVGCPCGRFSFCVRSCTSF